MSGAFLDLCDNDNNNLSSVQSLRVNLVNKYDLISTSTFSFVQDGNTEPRDS